MIKNSYISGERDYAIDFVKGFLVQVMTLYHSINYFLSPKHVSLRYIDFVTGAFVFVSGYVVTSFYIDKYKNAGGLMYYRLITRGLKIVLIFLLSNTLIHLSFTKNYNNVEFGLSQFYGNLFNILILGNKKLAAFEILLPIGYTLIISAILLISLRIPTLIIPVIIALFASSSLSTGLSPIFYVSKGVPSNLYFITIGLGGLAFGYIKKERCHQFNKKYLKALFLFPPMLYALCITIFEETLYLYFCGILSIFCCTYFVGKSLNYGNIANKTMVIFGKYSLVAYLSQVLFLQLLFRTSVLLDVPKPSLLCAFFLTNIFVYLLCRYIIYIRKRYRRLDMFYRIMFC